MLQLIFYTQSIYFFIKFIPEIQKSIYYFLFFVILLYKQKTTAKRAKQLFRFYILYIDTRDKKNKKQNRLIKFNKSITYKEREKVFNTGLSKKPLFFAFTKKWDERDKQYSKNYVLNKKNILVV